MNLSEKVSIGQIENKSEIKKKLESLKFGNLLQSCNIKKRISGDYNSQTLIYRIMVTIYMSKPLKVLWSKDNDIADCLKGAKKDSYYDLTKNAKLNWRKLLIGFFLRISKPLRQLANLKEQVLIIDDTPNPKTGKKIELLSLQYDHVEHKYFNGFTQVHLGWSDGSNYLPIDFCIKVGKTLRSKWNKVVDKRISGSLRRKESFETKLDQALNMLSKAYQTGITAGYVVFDTWFAKPAFLLSVFKIGYNSVCNIPKGDKFWQVIYHGKKHLLSDLYRLLKSREAFRNIVINGEKQKVASIVVKHGNGLTLKLVFCKVTSKKDWIVFASTDIDQTEYEILKTYAKRWGIECFFKSCKQLFQFGKEQSVDFDVQIAMTTIRLMAYSLVAAINREQKDERTLGQLFELIQNKFSNLNLDREIMEEIFAIILNMVNISEFALDELKKAFKIICENFTSIGMVSGNKQVA
jgi:hypothetical protein